MPLTEILQPIIYYKKVHPSPAALNKALHVNQKKDSSLVIARQFYAFAQLNLKKQHTRTKESLIANYLFKLNKVLTLMAKQIRAEVQTTL